MKWNRSSTKNRIKNQRNVSLISLDCGIFFVIKTTFRIIYSSNLLSVCSYLLIIITLIDKLKRWNGSNKLNHSSVLPSHYYISIQNYPSTVFTIILSTKKYVHYFLLHILFTISTKYIDYKQVHMKTIIINRKIIHFN